MGGGAKRGGGAPASPVVRAAGGVVWRSVGKGQSRAVEVLVVHRPRYDDWSHPKGKCEPGETDEDCARREVEEETGLRCDLGDPLGTTRYVDRKGRSKVVHYWAMAAPPGRFTPNAEVDEVRWMAPAKARGLLTYPYDVDVLDRLVERLTEG